MNTVDFCFWLQGFFEISGNTEINAKQAEIIKNHLNLVFKHEIDPLRESETTTLTSVLNYAHSPGVTLPNDQLIRC